MGHCTMSFTHLWPALVRAVVLVMLAVGAPAQAMNKCTAPDGKISYQDDACTSGKAEKADIPHYKPPPPPGTATAAAVQPAAHVTTPPTSQPQAKTKGIPEHAVVHVGPRGGRYILLPTGKKRYLPKEP